VGGGYTKLGFGDVSGYYTNMGTFEVVQNDNYNINMGVGYKASKMLTVNAGYMHTFYPNDLKVKALMAQPMDVDVTVNNSINAIALGINLSF
jgi:long-subunit fatty acid transport protein